MIWKASKKGLWVYTLKGNRRPAVSTRLYHAPFFNVYANSSVCMGTAVFDIEDIAGLESFMEEWQTCFFRSYFSHAMQGHVPVRRNMVSLWKGLVGTCLKFPGEIQIGRASCRERVCQYV